eukprot:CAMPEP_0194330022 /NCGR_PEP_ID=MMETSP0171-20130528/50241_1 /TAXON_ID=218684 /ORGANISM="Corethron pennatum, Strain L29A3" /LENGTH=246 /DNA_ID=CAMNT_0039090939 /DNA_START=10 /DNA_END=750 /DNA_ORIENTATION=+
MGRGKLTFKGEDGGKHSKKKKYSSSSKHRLKTKKIGGDAAHEYAGPHVTSPSAPASAPASVPIRAPAASMTPVPGPGTITTSSAVVAGHGTSFRSGPGIRRGDALIVEHPVSKITEMRVVTMVLGDTSMGISSAFSSDLSTGCDYATVSAPRDHGREKSERAARLKKDAEEVRRNAFGTYAGSDAVFQDGEGGTEADGNGGQSTEFVYRVNDGHGSYKIRREKVEGKISREDLVVMRGKKKSDKYC